MGRAGGRQSGLIDIGSGSIQDRGHAVDGTPGLRKSTALKLAAPRRHPHHPHMIQWLTPSPNSYRLHLQGSMAWITMVYAIKPDANNTLRRDAWTRHQAGIA